MGAPTSATMSSRDDRYTGSAPMNASGDSVHHQWNSSRPRPSRGASTRAAGTSRGRSRRSSARAAAAPASTRWASSRAAARRRPARDVQRIPPPANPGPVEEDAGVVDEPGHRRIAVSVLLGPRAQEASAASLGVELHLLRVAGGRRPSRRWRRRPRRRSGRRSCSSPASVPAPGRRGCRGNRRRRCTGSSSAGTSRRTPTCGARRGPRS